MHDTLVTKMKKLYKDPYVALIATIIASGLKNNDTDYVNSLTFEEHCNMINYDYEVLRLFYQQQEEIND